MPNSLMSSAKLRSANLPFFTSLVWRSRGTNPAGIGWEASAAKRIIQRWYNWARVISQYSPAAWLRKPCVCQKVSMISTCTMQETGLSTSSETGSWKWEDERMWAIIEEIAIYPIPGWPYAYTYLYSHVMWLRHYLFANFDNCCSRKKLSRAKMFFFHVQQ